MSAKNMAEIQHCMSPETMEAFMCYETERGTSVNMLRRFSCTVKAVYDVLPADKIITRERLVAWRESMVESGYAPLTIENYVKGINRYLDYVGCSAIRFNRGRSKDITGMTFGYLTAIQPTGEKNRSDVVWQCRCACGNTVELPATRLLLGNTMSCGCLQKKHRQETFLKANRTYAGTHLTQAVKEEIFSARNSSGYVGVFPKRDKWVATLKYKGKFYYLGTYCHIEEAIEARTAAKKLAVEDAKRLLAVYERLHESEPEPQSRENEERCTSPSVEPIEQERTSAMVRRNNTSGCVGVVFRHNRWEARICYRGIRYILGTFDEIDKAVSIRRKAETDLKNDAERFVREYAMTCTHHAYR